MAIQTRTIRSRLVGWMLFAGVAAFAAPASAQLSATAAWERVGPSGEHLGSGVGTAGDFDCDGIADLAIGNPTADVQPNGSPGWTNGGWVAVWYGGATLPAQPSSVPDWWVFGLVGVPGGGVGVQTNLGSAVAAGDLNGDRCDDLIVGAPTFFPGTIEGVAVFLGSASGPSTTPTWWTSSAPMDASRFGSSVAAGDVNGDGLADIVIGAPDGSLNVAHLGRGAVAVFLGSQNFATKPDGSFATADWTAYGDQDIAQLGASVASPGDVDGDGDDEVLAGAPLYSGGQSQEGIAVMWPGSPAFESTADGTYLNAGWRHELNLADAHVGQVVAGAGDINGDGLADMLIGAPSYDLSASTARGRVVVRLGTPGGPPSNVASWIHEGVLQHSFLGAAVATAGDVNGDGLADYLITEGGVADVHLWLGRPSWPGSPPPPDLTYDGPGTTPDTGAFGSDIGTAGDWNGDGFSDVVVAAPFSFGGRVLVYLGSGETVAANPSVTMTVAQVDAGLGLGLGFAGDINHDGCSDFVAGAPNYESEGAHDGEGRIFVGYASTPPCSGINEIIFPGDREGNQAGAQLGFSASGAGDVNGDGYGDVIAGAPGFDSPIPDVGLARIYLGGAAGLATSPSVSLLGLEEAGAQFGFAVAPAGDVNGDGYGDVIVGAPQASPGVTHAGRAFLYLGSATGLAPTHSWSANGTQVGAHYGVSVAGAGDVNRDGFSDVIVGADGHNGTGAAFVYLGQPTNAANPQGLGSTPVRTYFGTSGSSFGASVASAGDLNRDGYSDMVVGAPTADVGYFFPGGVARVFLGGSPPAVSANFELVGDPPDFDATRFGSGVSSAGDVNGDGYGDLIVGDQWHFGPAGFAQGKAYLFHGSAAGIGVAPARTLADCPTSFCDFGRNVSGEGDWNGDGIGDVLVGAFKFTQTSSFEGAVFVHLGNGGRGVPLRPLQGAGNGTVAPRALLGSTPDWYALSMDRPSPAGRTGVSIEFESKLLGVDFDGTPTSLLPTSFEDNVLDPRDEVAYFNFAGTTHTWRARLRSASPLFGRSRWVSLPGNGPRELDVRVIPEPGAAAGLLAGLGGLLFLAKRRALRAGSAGSRRN
jgi:hypothetical protein